MTNNDDVRNCMCGSGERKYPLHDARGIFCTYVCSQCEDAKRGEYRSDIFTDSQYWTEEPIEEDY